MVIEDIYEEIYLCGMLLLPMPRMLLNLHSTRESQCVENAAQDVIKSKTLSSGCKSVKDPLYRKHSGSQRTTGGLLLQES